MIALLSQWKTLSLGALCLLVAALFALWRMEAGHAQRLAQQTAEARAADGMDRAAAAASRAAATVIGQGADRDMRTLNQHVENSHAIQTARGSDQSLDPDLNAAGRRGLCGFDSFAADPACVQLRGLDPGQRPQAGGADGPAAP
ncbi:MAG: hypothetical protein WDN45_10395 [Caulobacteraceae bacterium]